MKIEEAKDYVEENACEGYFENQVVMPKEEILALLDQIELDQPKPVVPQMIFDVIESFDEDAEYLHEHLNHQSDEVREWLTHNERDFYEAWLAYPNITVKKEKLYTVEIPNPHAKGHNKIYLCKDGNTGKVYLCKGNFNPKKNKNLRLTEQEIRKDFDWAWQWKKEVTE